MKKVLPEKSEMFFTDTGIGKKSISKQGIRKNWKKLLHIREEAAAYFGKNRRLKRKRV